MDSVIVLLAAYNGQKWIEEQIVSILKQKGIKIKLYISCDLSTDGTIGIINSINDERIHLLPYGCKYGAAAPNFYRLLKDVDFTDYDYVALSDQDDIWLDDKIISAIQEIKKNKSIGYSSNVTAFWSDGRKKLLQKATPQKKYDYLFEGPGPGCSFVFTKDFAKEIQKQMIQAGDLMKKLDWHDWLLYSYARSHNYNWYIDSNSHMLYRQHENNQLGANAGIKQFIKRMEQVFSGYGIQQTVLTIYFNHEEENEFVKKWLNKGRLGYIYLALNSRNCRRKPLDQFFFFISCLIMFIKRTRMREE